MSEYPCASGEIHPDVWISDRGMDEAPEVMKEMCRGCPLNVECFEFAISHDVVGIWSGTTTKQRRAFRRKNRIRIPSVTDWINKELGMPSENGQAISRSYSRGSRSYNTNNLRQVETDGQVEHGTTGQGAVDTPDETGGQVCSMVTG